MAALTELKYPDYLPAECALKQKVGETKFAVMINELRIELQPSLSKAEFAFQPAVFYELVARSLHHVHQRLPKANRADVKVYTMELATRTADTFRILPDELDKIQYLIEHVCPAMLDVFCDLYDGKYQKTVRCCQVCGDCCFMILGKCFGCWTWCCR